MPETEAETDVAQENGAAGSSAAPGADIQQEIDPEIGLVGAIAIGVGTMIAAGIFVLSGLAVSNVGAVAIVAFLIAAVVAVNDSAFLDFLRNQADLGGLAPVQFVEENGEIAMGRAAQYYLGSFGFYVIIAGALFSMLSAANATILAGSRVKLAMARRRHLPKQFEDLHPSLNTPWKAVLLRGGLILFYIIVFSVLLGGVPGQESHGPPLGIAALEGVHLGIEALAHFADFMLLGGLIAVNLALIQSRRKHPDLERGFRMPGVP